MAVAHGRRNERGQIIVLAALALTVILLMAGLILDGGNAWAQQRQAQNGTDAAALAGASVLAEKLSNDPASYGAGAASWDAAVLASIRDMSLTNGNGSTVAYYTDVCGRLLTGTGAKAGSYDVAAQVGNGFPSSTAVTPTNCTGNVGPPAGVEVHDARTFGTYFIRIVGINSYTANSSATAVAYYDAQCQDVTQGCAVLPIAGPVWFSTCSGHDLYENEGTEWPMYTDIVLPFCFNSPGNIGWIDWTPPNGGASEVVDCTYHPCNPAIQLPSWDYITQTGTDHSAPEEAALNSWDGKVVMIPMFDHTCGDDTPDETQVSNVAAHYGCSNLDNSHGNSTWYRLVRFAAFKLEGAYTNGNNEGACHGVSKQCLIGQFVHWVVSGQVGPGSGGGTTTASVIGVQLIK